MIKPRRNDTKQTFLFTNKSKRKSNYLTRSNHIPEYSACYSYQTDCRVIVQSFWVGSRLIQMGLHSIPPAVCDPHQHFRRPQQRLQAQRKPISFCLELKQDEEQGALPQCQERSTASTDSIQGGSWSRSAHSHFLERKKKSCLQP